jgi:dipeptidyl aminopeptidase/acylaminoacyl peptidase
MKKIFLIIMISVFIFSGYGFSKLPEIPEIMKGKDFVGNWVDRLTWSPDSQSFYFLCEKYKTEEIFNYDVRTGKIKEVKEEDFSKLPINFYGSFFRRASEPSTKGHLILYAKRGDIYIYDIKTHEIKRVTDTKERESNPFFGNTTHKIYFIKDNNLYLINQESPSIQQLTTFTKMDKKRVKEEGLKVSKKVLSFYKKEEEKIFDEYKKESLKKEPTETEKPGREFTPKRVSMTLNSNMSVGWHYVTPDEKTLFFRVFEQKNKTKETMIPTYINGTGYTTTTKARPKSADEGIYQTTLYTADFKTGKIEEIKIPAENIYFRGFYPSPDNTRILCLANGLEGKNQYLFKLDPKTKEATQIYHAHNKAWIGHLSLSELDWIDNNWIYFNSEEDGFSHLYKLNVNTKEKIQITKGKYVVIKAKLSPNKKHLYYSANIDHPGKRNLYKIGINGKGFKQVTHLPGKNKFILSPNLKYIAIRHSESNKPWEIHLQKGENKSFKVKDFMTPEYKKHAWTKPEVITMKTKDGAVNIFSRIFVPEKPHSEKPGVIFIHGAGYLQNAHYGWSDYYREFMFHNKLQEAGYHVMDVDYSGSALYGADFRTRIYRHMGGKDLDDIVLAAEYLKSRYGVKKVGIYGGSYGGFLTIMGMFCKSDHFVSGAALRPVTDWAHYSNWWTANILNNPIQDYEAYEKSSPIYFAEGLKGHLLLCHGMIDDNVHFQGSVRLAQRLIELGKENWELAVYPLEKHSFTRASSWTDEYRRIWKLFEQTLK